MKEVYCAFVEGECCCSFAPRSTHNNTNEFNYIFFIFFGVFMKHVILFSTLFVFLVGVMDMSARIIKFAECRNGKVTYWTYQKDGTYKSEHTNIECNFKKDVVMAVSGRSAMPTISTVMNEIEWAEYYKQNSINIQPVIEEVVPSGTGTVKQLRPQLLQPIQPSLQSVSVTR